MRVSGQLKTDMPSKGVWALGRLGPTETAHQIHNLRRLNLEKFGIHVYNIYICIYVSVQHMLLVVFPQET